MFILQVKKSTSFWFQISVCLCNRCGGTVTSHANGPLTIVWDDGPGHGRGVNSSNHPEHAQPAQMLSSFLSSQHLRKVREHDWNCSTNPANIVRYNWLCTSNLISSVWATRNIWQISAKQIWSDRKSFGKKIQWVAHEDTSSTSSKPMSTCWTWGSGLTILKKGLLFVKLSVASVFCHLTKAAKRILCLSMFFFK